MYIVNSIWQYISGFGRGLKGDPVICHSSFTTRRSVDGFYSKSFSHMQMDHGLHCNQESLFTRTLTWACARRRKDSHFVTGTTLVTYRADNAYKLLSPLRTSLSYVGEINEGRRARFCSRNDRSRARSSLSEGFIILFS